MDIINMDTHKEIIAVLEGRTQAVIRNHFLRYDRAIRCQVKIITSKLWKLQKTNFYRSEHQKRKDEIRPFSRLAFLQLTTVYLSWNKLEYVSEYQIYSDIVNI